MNSADARVAADRTPGDSLPLKQPWRLLGQVAISILVDTLLLALFARAGTISYKVAALYALIAGACVVVFYVLLRSEWAARQPDPALTRAQLLTSSAVELGFALYAPPLAFYFFNILFLIFAFGALRLRLQQMLTSFIIVTLAGVLVRMQLGDRLSVPNATPAEQLLVWLGHAATLLRCCVAGWYGNNLRHALLRKNRELAAASARIGYLAMHDSLTGTLLRKPVWNLIEQQACPPVFSIVMLDIDHFKSINDQHGHIAGDEVLRQFAQTVNAQIRPGDAFGRYGGEEFLLLLPGAEPKAALATADRIRRAIIDADWQRIAPGLRVTVSAGVASAAPREPVRQLVDRADRALYAAKRGGRDCALLMRDDGRLEASDGSVVAELA
ncbi:GGDEF domain-containing protein [Solimonas soli]|uniref:GGDEF domain-containing protein n=1 Tax=Solimonas soli TaxID=413479 RepID=UPI0004867784|nr:GGDEF domain-containing protein [Solimonas soli]